jgi:hypothetical protein
MRGDNTTKVPGKTYTWGDFQFLVTFDAGLPQGAVRRYIADTSIRQALAKAQGGADVVAQEELDAIPYAPDGRPPASLLGQK